MTETILAILSPDNVLRLVSSNGKGIEEKAAIALSHEYPLPSLVELVETLIRITEPPAPEKPKTVAAKAAKPKEKKAPVKEKRQRSEPHTWLKSSTLIRFIDANPGMTVPTVAAHMCAALGKEYTSSNKGYGDVVRSRMGNLVNSGKLFRGDDAGYFATADGVNWADKTDPLADHVLEGQELLAE